MIDRDPFARIIVSGHALERTRTWFPDGRYDEDAIRGEIRSAILEGRVTDAQPNWLRGSSAYDFHKDPKRGHWYVWPPELTHAWALADRHDATAVATILLSHDYEQELADARRLRTGYRRS